MRDSLLRYTIVCSVGVHLAILGVIGRTSAVKPIDVEQLKIVRVDLVKTPEHVNLKPDQPKPEPKVEPKPVGTFEPPPVYVPPVQHMKAAPLPKPQAIRKATAQAAAEAKAAQAKAAQSTQAAADPGGDLNLGSGSEHGDLNLATGATSVGSVPSPVGGQGAGSGTGKGVGSAEPDPNASSGPGTRTGTGSSVTPPPPPPPKMVEVTVCARSGKLPGQYCKDKDRRSFRDGDEPRRICDDCKAPEPQHVNRLADRAEPELVKDARVDVPQSVADEGVDTKVTVTYTVDTDGSVSNVKVTDSSGNSALDRAVVRAAEKMKYKPAVQDGVPRAVTKRRTYRIRA